MYILWQTLFLDKLNFPSVLKHILQVQGGELLLCGSAHSGSQETRGSV